MRADQASTPTNLKALVPWEYAVEHSANCVDLFLIVSEVDRRTYDL
jgi:hypothetical protein